MGGRSRRSRLSTVMMAAGQRSRSSSVPRSLVRSLVGLLALTASMVGIATGLARAAPDPCLVGTWEAPISTTPWPYSGTLTLTIPNATEGEATIAVHATKVPEGHPLTIPYSEPATASYAVGAASTPENPAGSIAFTPAPTNALYEGQFLNLLLNVAPTFGSNYSCTEGSLNLPVTLDIETGLVLSANSFTRSGAGPAPVNLQVVHQGTGQGNVISSPGGIDCPPACSGSFWPGTSVKLAAARTGSWFMGWSGPCTPLAPLSVEAGNVLAERECQLTGGGVVTATFGEELWVAITGSGTVTGGTTASPLLGGFAPPTIACPGDCSAYIAQEATLRATPAHGYRLDRFGGWTGPCIRPRPDTCQLAMTEYSPVTAIFTVIEPQAAKLKGKFLRSFQGRHAEQTRLQPGTSLWRGENMIPGHPGLGSHPQEAYFGLEQPTTSAQAEKLYNIAIWKNKAECLQEYKVTTAWRAYVGRVAGGAGTQVLAEARRGQRVLKIPEMLRKGWVSTVGPCTPLPLA
jgi:hypothetical protein